MHEASLMRSLMERIDRVLTEEGAARVVEVTVRLGALSHISADHFREHFARAAEGGAAANAALHVIPSDDPSAAFAQDVILESVVVESVAVET
ncbi:MAG: hydrogenase maturation nickel metallochaperone HypA [Myxococcales bacterium]|nr:hydrogenase maturation nickel metallochaperone HypA [Myxococcales bacterium]